jgi:putative membrane protein
MFDLDLVLAILHHLAVFTLVGIMAAEFALLRPGLVGERLAFLGRIDSAYGAVAGLVLVAGFLRVFFGAAGAGYYLGNWVFWSKIGAFVLVGVLSGPATMAIARWRREAKASPAFEPGIDAVAGARKFLYAQIAVLALIPIFAAAMARGYGV